MRFRWNEKNPVRKNMFSSILSDYSLQSEFVPVELIHSKIVYDVSSVEDTKNKQGDGIITCNKNLIPVVTVADCVPVYFYDCKSQVFGVVHSGWKGTGIIEDALKIAVKKYSCAIEDICVAIGPHIHDCCYVVNEERAAYFVDNFSKECVKKIDRDFFALTKPFTALDSDFIAGKGINAECYPPQFPNQIILASSAEDIFTELWDSYLMGAKEMIMGNLDYFVCDIDCRFSLAPKMNGEPFKPLVTQAVIDDAIAKGEKLLAAAKKA
jgi:YfiH family protein